MVRKITICISEDLGRRLDKASLAVGGRKKTKLISAMLGDELPPEDELDAFLYHRRISWSKRAGRKAPKTPSFVLKWKNNDNKPQ